MAMAEPLSIDGKPKHPSRGMPLPDFISMTTGGGRCEVTEASARGELRSLPSTKAYLGQGTMESRSNAAGAACHNGTTSR